MLAAARNREAYARLAWSPYMHNPKLKNRLHRIKLPTLFLWGTADRVLSEKYGRGYCGLIAGAKFETDREAPAISRISSSRTNSPAVCSPSPKRRAPRRATRETSLKETSAMQVYHFTEQPYYPTWNNHSGSLRVNLPNSVVDPKIAGDLFHRYYDEWKLADELGYNIMVNEHHQTATCMSSTVIVGLSVLARETKKARLLVLGYPIGHRPDPLRCAEELATIDVVSRGRLDMGFIKGVPYEFPASNQNPVGVMDRFWEAHDFILKAMTQPRRAVQLGGRVLPLPAGQHLAAAGAAAASAGLDHHRQQGAGAAARREGLCDGDARLGLRHAAAL